MTAKYSASSNPERFARARRKPAASLLGFSLLGLSMLSLSCSAHAADAAPSDTLVFSNGDSIKGKLVSANNTGVTFHSDMAGDLTISWDKIKTVDAMEKFAIIKQRQKVSRKTPRADVPEGTVAISDKSVKVTTPGGTTTISTSDTQAIVDAPTFEKTVFHEPGLTHGYTGALTLGISDVQSTQTAETFNGALTLVRTIPNAAWISPRNKTIFDASAVYGLQTQKANPALGTVYSSVKTNILHGDLERDQYLSPRFYYLGYGSADHNYAQGLALQDIFGGGFGYTVIKDKLQELDIKTDLHYEQQRFTPSIAPTVSTPNNNLIGMDFSEMYMRKLPKGLVLNETGVVTPAFNNATASASVPNPGHPFSSDFTGEIVFPVYKNLGFNAGVIDNYLSDPAPGFNNNSFQFNIGATYSFK